MKKYIKSKIEKYKKSSLTYKLLLMIFVFFDNYNNCDRLDM